MTATRITLPGSPRRFATAVGRREGIAARSHLSEANAQDAFLDDRSERIAQRFEQPLLAAAVLTIPLIILQFMPPADPWREIADALNWLTWLAFVTELVVMLAVVPSKRAWLRKHPIDVAIVVLTPPFVTAAVQSLRALRLLRMLRLLRLAPLVRVLFSGEGLRCSALLTALTALAGGASFASVEKLPIGDGIYWAITTMTTVGSGITAKTSEGKAITVAVIFVGIGFAALVIGAAADRFVNPRGQKAESTEDALLAHVKDLSAEVQRLERTLQQRQSA